DESTIPGVRDLRGHGDRVRALAFSPDGKRLASSGADRTIKLWEMGPGDRVYGREASSLKERGDYLEFSRDGRLLAIGNGPEAIVKIWGAEEGRLIRNLPAPKGVLIHGMTLSPDNRHLAAGNMNIAVIWDVTTGQKVRELPNLGDDVMQLAYSP